MKLAKSIGDYLGIETKQVTYLANKAPQLYRRYKVPKRKGGHREIFHPAKEVKALQNAVIYLLDDTDFTHDAAMGYVPGLKSPLLKNAKAHAQNKFLLKLDFIDFFPSLTLRLFESIFKDKLQNVLTNHSDFDLFTNITFIKQKISRFLAIGAPSSPPISNWILCDLDEKFCNLCVENECAYTRYADDICISSNVRENLHFVEKKFNCILKNSKYYNNLFFNEDKRCFATPWSRRYITGLVITPSGKVKVPRSTKRDVRIEIHKYKNKQLTKPKEIRKLSGYLSFINDCEPEYINNLAYKYGANTIMEIRKFSFLQTTK